jgi:hypothetical protein
MARRVRTAILVGIACTCFPAIGHNTGNSASSVSAQESMQSQASGVDSSSRLTPGTLKAGVLPSNLSTHLHALQSSSNSTESTLRAHATPPVVNGADNQKETAPPGDSPNAGEVAPPVSPNPGPGIVIDIRPEKIQCPTGQTPVGHSDGSVTCGQ